MRLLTSNMHEVFRKDYIVLVSYSRPVAAVHIDGKAYRTSSVWSPATTRHINRWLNGVIDVAERPQAFFNSLFRKGLSCDLLGKGA